MYEVNLPIVKQKRVPVFATMDYIINAWADAGDKPTRIRLSLTTFHWLKRDLMITTRGKYEPVDGLPVKAYYRGLPIILDKNLRRSEVTVEVAQKVV